MPKSRSLLESFDAMDLGGEPTLRLEDGSRVAVIGGGPAGSLFSFFVSKMARAIGQTIELEIYEPRHFTHSGPAGCNHCGGIVSESLVQLLATEGINIPPNVVQRGVDSYILHMDVGSVRIDTPLFEKRIAAVYRGNGPRNSEKMRSGSFDSYLQQLAVNERTTIRRHLVKTVVPEEDAVRVVCVDGTSERYDLVAVAVGVNSKLLEELARQFPRFEPPGLVKTFICEYHLGRERIEEILGTSMHVFLLDLPRLEFAAIIPKGDYVTACLLGDDIDDDLIDDFLNSAEVRSIFPEDVVPRNSVCHCFPRINVGGSSRPFADRMVWIGDSGVTRLYKDGIGAAYRTAKAAAAAVVFHGTSEEDLKRHYLPTCKAISFDNGIGKFMFGFSGLLQKMKFSRRAILRMTTLEQAAGGGGRHMSSVLWDLFSGSAPYQEVFLRTLHPGFLTRLAWNLGCGIVGRNGRRKISGNP